MPQFETYYRTTVAPLLSAREGERLAAVKRLQRLKWGGGAAALGVAGLGSALSSEPMMFVFIGMAVFGVPFAIGHAGVANVAKGVKDDMLSAIASFAGVTYAREVPTPAPIDSFNTLNLTPSYDRATFEDWLEGERAGAGFALFEAHLERESRDKDGDTSYSTVFQGQLLRIQFPRAFLGTTLVLRDAGLFNALRRPGKGLERVGLVDPKFEKTFEVYGTDQVEARYLVDPSFMERLLHLEDALHGEKARAGFSGGELLVAIEGGNLFEAGSMFTPLDDPDRARGVLDDIEAIGAIIDTLVERGPQNTAI